MPVEKYYLDGPGETLVVTTDFDFANPDPDKIFAVITSKSASLTYGVTEENVTGGRSLFPRRKFMTERTVTLELEDCETDFRYWQLSQGGSLETKATTAWAYGSDQRYTVPTTSPYTVTLSSTPLDGKCFVREIGGTAFAIGATPAVGATVSLSGNVLTFASGDAGKEIEAIYQYMTTSTTQVSQVSIESIPKTVKLIHTMPAFDEDNNEIGKDQLEIFKAQVSAEFNEAYAERQAYAPRLKFDLVDPKRPDGLLMEKRFIPKA